MPSIVTESEKKYLTYALAIAIGWTLLITAFPNTITSQSSLVQFVAITLIKYVLLAIVLAIYLNNGEISEKKTIASFLFFASWDLLFSGATNPSGLTIGSFVQSAWQSVGLTGLPLMIVAFPVTFLAIQGIVCYLLTGKQLWSIAKV